MSYTWSRFHVCSMCLCSFIFTGTARICDSANLWCHTRGSRCENQAAIVTWQIKAVFFNFVSYLLISLLVYSFQWFRFGRFISLFWVLVHAFSLGFTEVAKKNLMGLGTGMSRILSNIVPRTFLSLVMDKGNEDCSLFVMYVFCACSGK